MLVLVIAAGGFLWFNSQRVPEWGILPDFFREITDTIPQQTETTRKPAATLPAETNADSPDSTPTLTMTETEVPLQSTPAPAAAARPDLLHLDEKRHMLELINAERGKAGIGAVVLGDNIAAQLHADASLANCSSSHWGSDGLKPYMRYSLAGGYQSNGENGHGLDYCIKASDGYRVDNGIRQEIKDAMAGWMDSPGHRRNILDHTHQKVNIGIAWDRYNTVMYQHFEGDYAEYDQLPAITDGMLTLSGRTKNGARLNGARDLGVQVYYDQPPGPLTRGQLARTYCYDNGRKVAGLREPLTGGYYWPTDEFTTTHDPCPSPYDVPADTPEPRSHNEAHRAWEEAYSASQLRGTQTIAVPWLTAKEWSVRANAFVVKADISDILRRNGNGVYSVMVWGNLAGQDLVISQYSVFYGITPPDTYRFP